MASFRGQFWNLPRLAMMASFHGQFPQNMVSFATMASVWPVLRVGHGQSWQSGNHDQFGWPEVWPVLMASFEGKLAIAKAWPVLDGQF